MTRPHFGLPLCRSKMLFASQGPNRYQNGITYRSSGYGSNWVITHWWWMIILLGLQFRPIPWLGETMDSLLLALQTGAPWRPARSPSHHIARTSATKTWKPAAGFEDFFQCLISSVKSNYWTSKSSIIFYNPSNSEIKWITMNHLVLHVFVFLFFRCVPAIFPQLEDGPES